VPSIPEELGVTAPQEAAVAANHPTILSRIRETASRALGLTVVSELIGRTAYPEIQYALFRSRARPVSVDYTVPDYEFYDRLRRGKAAGYRLGGLFAKRLERVVASWVLGDGLTVELYESSAESIPAERRDHTNAVLQEFVQSLLDAGADTDDEESDPDRDDRSQSLLQSSYCDAMGLGDLYLIVNADGSISVPSPETVTIARDPMDYRRWLSVTVTTKTDKATITDEYRADGRTVTVTEGANVVSVDEYQNLIGRIPIVHIAHGRSTNETNGHPVHEELLELYDRYDDILYKQLDGAALLGNPIPAFVGLKDLNAIKNANQPAANDTYTDKDGYTATREQFMFDRNAVLLLGEGGDAKFVSPPVGFTEDTKTALKSLFLLLLDHTGIPESVWGAELGSARATADTQQSQFVKEVQSWRMDAGGWIVRLCKIWLQMRALTDPDVWVGRLALEWPPLVQEDKELRLKFVELGRRESLLTDETTLGLLELVDDAKAEVEAAQSEADARQAAAFPEGTDAQFGAALMDAQNQDGQQDGVMQMWELDGARPDVPIVEAVRELRARLLEVSVGN
jgi:hypothetical protein